MCEKYPGLKIAFENFRMFYEMVKDDYDNPTPKKYIIKLVRTA